MKVELERQLPGGFQAASVARSVCDDLAERIEPRLVDDARLLINELVTNSVRHARVSTADSITIKVLSSEEAWRVEVHDHGPGFDPVQRAPSSDEDSGWGLYLVDRIAARWGVSREPATCVWFELDR